MFDFKSFVTNSASKNIILFFEIYFKKTYLSFFLFFFAFFLSSGDSFCQHMGKNGIKENLSLGGFAKYYPSYQNENAFENRGLGLSEVNYSYSKQIGLGIDIGYKLTKNIGVVFSAEYRQERKNIEILTPKFVDQNAFFDPQLFTIEQPIVDYSLSIYYTIKKHSLILGYNNPVALTDYYDVNPREVSLLVDLHTDAMGTLTGGAVAIKKNIQFPEGGYTFSSPQLGYKCELLNNFSLVFNLRYRWYPNTTLFRWTSEGEVPQFPNSNGMKLDDIKISNRFLNISIGLHYTFYRKYKE
jgi:hypothetical protein